MPLSEALRLAADYLRSQETASAPSDADAKRKRTDSSQPLADVLDAERFKIEEEEKCALHISLFLVLTVHSTACARGRSQVCAVESL